MLLATKQCGVRAFRIEKTIVNYGTVNFCIGDFAFDGLATLVGHDSLDALLQYCSMLERYGGNGA